MKKIQLGCGHNVLRDDWINFDIEVDITKPLPFEDNSIDFIFLEHVLEHVNQIKGYEFLKEVKRILKPNGVIRIVIPSLMDIYKNITPEYIDKVNDYLVKNKDIDLDIVISQYKTKKDAIEGIIYNWGHKSIWTGELLQLLLIILEFDIVIETPNHSKHLELSNIDKHWKNTIVQKTESFTIEATKLINNG